MSLLAIDNAELAFGLHPLLDRASLIVQEGERIGLIGRNGTGKSSLLNIIAGQGALDDGEIRRADGLHVVMVEQEPLLPDADSLHASLTMRGRLEDMHDERERWRTDARLFEYLHRFGLDEFHRSSPSSRAPRRTASRTSH
jgi:ATP-binding cassette subfamily F protein uup